MPDFVIPVSRSDLLKKAIPNAYVVDEVVAVRHIRNQLPKCLRILSAEGHTYILRTFDVLFSVLSEWQSVSTDTKEEAWSLTLKGCEVCLHQLVGVLEATEGGLLQINRTELAGHRNSLKMHVYLLCQFVDTFENELNAHAKSKEAVKIGRSRGRGRRGARSNENTNATGGALNLSMEWIEECERAMTVLDQLCRLQLNKLWDPPVIEEDFINLSANCCYKLLENRSMASSSNMRSAMTSLLSSLVRRYGHNIACCVKLTQLLKCFAHMPNCLSAFVRSFMEEENLSGLVRELLKEICSYSGSDLERDTQAVTHFSNFLLDVSGTYPQLVQTILPMLRPRLDEDPYQMRNCVLGVIGEVLPLFARREQLDPKERVQRERLMDLLQEHIHDVNGYVRAKALQIWHAIVTTRGLPVRRQSQLASLLVGPLGAMFDVSSLARRYACKTLTAMVLQTPAAKLTCEELQQVLNKEKKRLETVEELLSRVSPCEDDNIVDVPNLEAAENEPNIQLNEVQSGETNNKKNTRNQREKGDVQTKRTGSKRRRSLDTDSDSGNEEDADVTSDASDKGDQVPTGGSGSTEGADDEEEEHLTTPSQELSSSIALQDVDVAALFEADIHSGAATAAAMLSSNHPVRSTSVAHAELTGTVQRQRACVSFLKEMAVFTGHIHVAIKDFQTMLASKTLTDVTEAIDFFVAAKRAGVRGLDGGIQQIFVQVWSQDEPIRKAVIEAFRKLYLQAEPDEPIGASDELTTDTADTIIGNLSQLVQSANIGNLVSIERMLQQLITSEQFNVSLTSHLWQRFITSAGRIVQPLARQQAAGEQTVLSEVNSMLLLLKMIVKSGCKELTKHLDALLEYGLQTQTESSKVDMTCVKCTCDVIRRMVPRAKSEKSGGGKTLKNQEPYRLAANHQLFNRLRTILVGTVGHSKHDQWVPMMEQIIATVYDLAENPDNWSTGVTSLIADKVVLSCKQAAKSKETAKETPCQDVPLEETENSDPQKAAAAIGEQLLEIKLEPQTAVSAVGGLNSGVLIHCSSSLLSRFLALVGHVCLKQLVHVESNVLTELKRRANLREAAHESKSKLKAARRARQSLLSTISTHTTTTLNASLATTTGAPTPAPAGGANDEESGLIGAAADDAEADYVRQICDREMLTAPNHFFAPLLTLVTHVCSNPSMFPNEAVQASASLSLAKMMLVTAEICEPRLQLLFTMAERSSSEVVRANLVVALGDLCRRFPNLIEPWTPNLYARLRDTAAKVRTNALNTLSHLILNDMIKVKGQLSEMTVCLVDGIDRLNVLARQFFNELAHKGNALYNVMPDIISRLSDPEIGVSEEDFHAIIDFLLPLIGRERLCETLVEKICARFRATSLQRQWRDLAHCLSAMSFNDRMMRVLYENVPAFADKLCIPEVHAAFEAIIVNAKKSTKPDGLARLEEFEAKVNEFHEKGVADEAAVRRAELAAKAVKQRGRQNRTHASQQSRSTGAARRNVRQSTTNTRRPHDTNLDYEGDVQGANVEPVSRPTRTTRAAASNEGRRGRLVYSSSEDDEEQQESPPSSDEA